MLMNLRIKVLLQIKIRVECVQSLLEQVALNHKASITSGEL